MTSKVSAYRVEFWKKLSLKWDKYFSAEVFLLTATIVSGALYIVAYNKSIDWFKEISLSTGTSTFSVWVTILTINRIDERQRTKETKAQTELAYKQLTPLLSRHLLLIQLIFKASRENELNSSIQNYEDLLSDEFISVFGNLDLSKPSNILPSPLLIWGSHIKFAITELRTELGYVLGSFGHALDYKDAILISNLRDSKMFNYLSQVPTLIVNASRFGFSVSDGFRLRSFINKEEDIRDYRDNLSKLINRVNEVLGDPHAVLFDVQIWNASTAPILIVSE